MILRSVALILSVAATSGVAITMAKPAEAEIYNPCPSAADEMGSLATDLRFGDRVPGNIAMVRDSFQRNAALIAKGCKKGDPASAYADATTTLVRAWLQHYAAKPTADTMLELAVQKLTHCIGAYYGSSAGANCAQMQKMAIHWQTSGWPSADATP
jgi:hypothetical protein